MRRPLRPQPITPPPPPPPVTEPESATAKGNLDYRKSYDIADLGKAGRGPWRIEASLSDPTVSRRHATLTPGVVHECSVPNAEMCLQIKIWHRPYKAKQMVVVEDIFTSVSITEGTHCAHWKIEDHKSQYLQKIITRERKPRSESQEKQTGGRRKKGFRGVPAHEVRTTRQSAAKGIAAGEQLLAASLFQDHDAHTKALSLPDTSGCSPQNSRPPFPSAGDTASQAAPATRHDATVHNPNTMSLDQVGSSWFEPLDDHPRPEHSLHGHCTATFAATEPVASDVYEMEDDREDDIHADAMSFADSDNDEFQLDTFTHGTYMHDDTSFMVADHAEPAGGDALDEEEASFSTSTAPNDAADSAREFSHMAPKYHHQTPLHLDDNHRAAPEPNMGGGGLPSTTMTLYEEMLGAQLAPGISPNRPPPPSFATIAAAAAAAVSPQLPGPMAPPPRYPTTASQAVTNNSTIAPRSAAPSTLPVTKARATPPTTYPGAPASTTYPPSLTSSSFLEWVDLTNNSPAAAQRRKPRHTHAIRGGGRGGRRRSAVANPLRPIKH